VPPAETLERLDGLAGRPLATHRADWQKAIGLP
jgi:hypothetical protein